MGDPSGGNLGGGPGSSNFGAGDPSGGLDTSAYGGGYGGGGGGGGGVGDLTGSGGGGGDNAYGSTGAGGYGGGASSYDASNAYTPSSYTNVTTPQSQAPTPGTTTTSTGGTQSDQTGPSGGKSGGQSSSQLQQMIQQAVKAIQSAKPPAQAATGGPSNLTPTLDQLNQQQQQIRQGARGTQSGAAATPPDQQSPLDQANPDQTAGVQGAPGTQSGTSVTSPDANAPPGAGYGGGSPTQQQDPLAGGPPPAGQGFGGGSPTQQATNAASAAPPAGQGYGGGSPTAQQAPDTSGAPPAGQGYGGGATTPDASQAAPTAATTPSTAGGGGQGAQQQNPMRFLGDLIGAFLGNPGPLMRDLMPQLGDLSRQAGQQTQYGPQTAQPAEPNQQPPAQQGQEPVANEEERQRQQRQQDTGQPGTYVMGDDGKPMLVKTDAQGNPQFDQNGKPIPADPQQGAQQQGGRTASAGEAPGDGRVNYFQRHGGQRGANITPINTPFGPVNVNRAVAPDAQGLFQDLKAQGAPIQKLGGFNDRQMRWSNMPSSHAYGAAIDLDDSLGFANNPALGQWIQTHQQAFNETLQKWNFTRPLPTKDPNHLEWTGPRSGTAIASREAPQPLPQGYSRPPAGLTGDTPPRFATVRSNNPGALNMGPSARKFGATGSQMISGRNPIAQFPSPVNGAAANMDNLANSGNYVGKTIGQAMHTWSGGGRFDPGPNSGFNRNTVITRQMTQDPNFMIPFMKAVSTGEAPGRFPMSDAQWQQAFRWYQQGGAPQGEAALQRGQQGTNQGSRPTAQQPRIRGNDLLPRTANQQTAMMVNPNDPILRGGAGTVPPMYQDPDSQYYANPIPPNNEPGRPGVEPWGRDPYSVPINPPFIPNFQRDSQEA